MDINKFIDSIENELFNRIRNSKSDAEARRLLKEQQALQLLQPDVTSSTLMDIMAQITKDLAKAEENTIKEVLRQILKREPTLEDAKYLSKFQQEGVFNKYYLAYKDLKLGTVYLNTSIDGGKMGVEFVPFETKDFLEPSTNADGTKVTF